MKNSLSDNLSIAILLVISPSISLAIQEHSLLTLASNPQADYSLKIVFAIMVLSILPALLMTLTSFTRILIVLAIVRQAIGMPHIPTNQVLIGLALLLTSFIMTPVFKEINQTALQPYLDQKIPTTTALERGVLPLKKFMLAQTHQDDLALFNKIAGNTKYPKDINTLPLPILMTAFITSELKTAFQIGFLIFIPFLIIDLVVASVLMSMGMMMLSPLAVSLPFKIMLFVMVNWWALIISSLASSFIL